MQTRVLPIAVVLALSLALAASLAAHAPARLPAAALGTVLVWRVEVACIVFAASYGAIVVVRLALHGETLTRVGREGIEVPRVGAGAAAEPPGAEEAAAHAMELQRLIAMAVPRTEPDDPTHPLLRPHKEDT